jgi:hypothetical protein
MKTGCWLAGVVLLMMGVMSGCACWGGNRAPEGYEALFNGKDLHGWQGLVEDPPKRERMTHGDYKRAQAAANERMRAHWSVRDGVLVFDGGGDNLCTVEDFGDFELMLEYRIQKDGDSGVYVRGSPQVQIWDNPIGSGGLYNNERHASRPLAVADRPAGEWNAMRIRMIGERVSVWLNGVLVVDDTVLENYWERDRPIYATGPIELQSHGNRLEFRDIFVKRLGEGATR